MRHSSAYIRSYFRSKNALRKIPNALRRLTNAVRKTANAFRRLTNAVRKIPNVFRRLTNAVRKIPNAFRRLTNAVRKTANALHRLINAIRKIANALRRLTNAGAKTSTDPDGRGNIFPDFCLPSLRDFFFRLHTQNAEGRVKSRFGIVQPLGSSGVSFLTTVAPFIVSRR